MGDLAKEEQVNTYLSLERQSCSSNSVQFQFFRLLIPQRSHSHCSSVYFLFDIPGQALSRFARTRLTPLIRSSICFSLSRLFINLFLNMILSLLQHQQLTPQFNDRIPSGFFMVITTASEPAHPGHAVWVIRSG
jgi:hypothetical protein